MCILNHSARFPPQQNEYCSSYQPISSDHSLSAVQQHLVLLPFALQAVPSYHLPNCQSQQGEYRVFRLLGVESTEPGDSVLDSDAATFRIFRWVGIPGL